MLVDKKIQVWTYITVVNTIAAIGALPICFCSDVFYLICGKLSGILYFPRNSPTINKPCPITNTSHIVILRIVSNYEIELFTG